MSIPSFSAPKIISAPAVSSAVHKPRMEREEQVRKVPRRSVDKKLKDPAAPKKPLSAYMIFSQEERAQVLADLGNLSMGEAATELGRRWASLAPELRAKFEKSTTEKERYAEEMKDYTPSKEFLEAKSEQEARVAVIADAEDANVDSPLLAYFTFLLSAWRPLSEAVPGLSPNEIQRAVLKAWQYATGETEGDVTTLTGTKEKKTKDPNEPKRPKNAFLLYSDSVREGILENNPSLAHKEVLKLVAEKWAGLSEEEKKPFMEAYVELQEKYKRDVEAYKACLQSEIK